jgi:hypothetical protein
MPVKIQPFFVATDPTQLFHLIQNDADCGDEGTQTQHGRVPKS